MKKLKETDRKKLEKFVNETTEKSLLSSLLGGTGGANGTSKKCAVDWHFAKTTFVNYTTG